MSELAIYFEGNQDICANIQALAQTKEHDTSALTPSGSNFEALNAPITGAELIIAAHVVTAAFHAATAAITFMKEVRSLLRPQQSVAASRNGRQRPLRISSSTSDQEIDDYVQNDDIGGDGAILSDSTERRKRSVFKLVQTDPETSAIHVNIDALQRHKYSSSLLSSLAAIRSGRMRELIRLLHRLPDTHEVAYATAFTSMMVHELKHHMDLLLTPYGFHRLRTAFWFYTLTPIILHKTDMIFPITQGIDEFNQKRFGIADYSTSEGYFISEIMANRNNVITRDNQAITIREQISFQHGGDAIMESLAFTFQAELLQHGAHTSPYLRHIMPYAFVTDDNSEDSLPSEQSRFIDLRYKWHYTLRNLLSIKSDIGAIRLINAVLFACLCGSFVKGATPTLVNAESFHSGPLSGLKVRYVDDSLPSRRLDALIGWIADYLDARTISDISWEEAWSLIEQAHLSIWGNTVIDEIEQDLAHDRALREQIMATFDLHLSSETRQNPVESLPHLAFLDILETRSRIFSAFKADPIRFIRPLDFADLTDELGAAPFYYVSPFGTNEPFAESKPVITRYVSVPEAMMPQELKKQNATAGQELEWRTTLVYSSVEMKVAWGCRDIRMHEESWASMLAVMAPIYKLALYGLRYRTMLEIDMVDAVATMKKVSPNIRWDPFYLRPGDISSASEYFHFYDLETAECDICSAPNSEKNMLVVSAATLRQSTAFRDDQNARFGKFATFVSLGRDWSSWLVCTHCYGKFVEQRDAPPTVSPAPPATTDQKTDPLQAEDLHQYLLSLIIDDDAQTAADLQIIEAREGTIPYFVSAVRRNFEYTVKLFSCGEYGSVIAQWEPWQTHNLMSPESNAWRDKPYFRTAVRSIISMIFISHVNMNGAEDYCLHITAAFKLLSRIAPGSPISDEWSEYFPLSPDTCRIQDENYLDTLTFAQEWLSAYAPEVLDICGISAETSQCVADEVTHTVALIRKALDKSETNGQ